MKQQKRGIKKSLPVLVAGGLLATVLGSAAVINLINTVITTPTPPPANKVSPLALTLEAIGLTQTAVSLPTATATNTPTDTPVPTVAVTNTLAPTRTFTPTPTATFVPYIPPTAEILQPTVPSGGTCSCNGDTLNCGDFGSHSSAQSCFNYCMSIGAGDIHKLDGNNDGNACENLP